MFLSRVFSFAVLSVSIIAAAATPAAPVKKREDALSVVNSLKSSTDTILPQIDSLVASNTATQDNISPLLANLVDALNAASTSLNGLHGQSGGSANEVANAAAPVFTNLANSLNNLKRHKPDLAFLFITFGIDAALNRVVHGLELVVAGIIGLLNVLLISIGGILSGLGFLLTGVTLGLLGIL